MSCALLQGRLALRFVLALATGTCLFAGARAGEPANPLRLTKAPLATAATTTAQASEAETANAKTTALWDEGRPRPLAYSLVSADSLAADPPSIVPPSLGPPELLPAPGGVRVPPEGAPSFEWQEFGADRHLVHPWLDKPWFAHSDPNDPHRHIGLGQPLIGTSWRNRPWFVGTFVGGVLMDDLVSNRVYQNDTSLIGLRLGFDFDHFWGLDGRWAFANPELTNSAGTPLTDPSRDNFADVSLAYFPLGDARWRPYVSAGLGFQTFRFHDDLDRRISEAMLSVPLGVGVKYFYGPWFSLRFDLYDNLGLGNARLSGMHNFSLMAGVEFRFGGRRQSYYPWHNNTSYW